MYIFVLVVGAGFVDLALTGRDRAQQTLYRIVFAVVWFLFVIRYYYGGDIYTYVPIYEHLHPWQWYLRHPDHYEYEHGYILFCAILKGLGLSYYWMTAIVTTFYFAVIALLFRRIKRHKTIALTILVMLDYNLIFAAHRQCLSVSFFLLMVLLMDKRKYVWALLCAWLTVEMHKSGIFIVSLAWLFFLVHHHKLERWFFIGILVLLFLMLVLPVSTISSAIISSLPLPESFVLSLNLHLALGRQFQAAWLLYAAAVVFMEYYLQNRNDIGRGTEAAVIMGLLLTALFYHYFYLLWRIRSFFLPVLIMYLFRVVQDAEDAEPLRENAMTIVKNLSLMLVLCFFAYRAVFFEIGTHKFRANLHSPGGKNIYTPCTVFDLRHHSRTYLRQERLKIAECYWFYDFIPEKDQFQIKKPAH